VTEEVRQVLERLIYDQRTRVLRQSLRDMSKLVVEHAEIGNVLSKSLETICYPVMATYGVILVFNQEEACPMGTYRWHDSKAPFLRKDFEADNARHLQPGSLPEPFLETTLLIPLYASQEQIGALLLGRPENGIHYSREDLLLLEGSIDGLTELIIKNRRIYEYLDQIVQLPLQQASSNIDLIPTAWVEDALQNICDYAYLGDSPLVKLRQVAAIQNGPAVTHLDQGKAVHQVLSEAVEKLRPEPALPSGPIPREWFPYLILHDAYFNGLPNRDITLKLYISEGTFHRTRRSALRSVTRVLSELESSIN
jgi:GAF domain-containing protein